MTIRLGFPVKVLGVTGLKSHDTRRWQNGPHLSVSLAYLRDVLDYLQRQEIHFYRFSSELAPYATHPDFPQFHNQIAECERELAAIGEMARANRVRLSVHPGQYVVLNAPEEELAERARKEVIHQARLLEAMGLGWEGVVLLHVGGVYGDHRAARERFVRQVERLPSEARRRLALENDDHRFSVDDCLWIHERADIPLVFDYLHFRCHNPEGMALSEAVSSCLATWPEGVPPKMHFSSPRTAMVVVEQQDAMSDQVRRRTRAPQPTQHADYLNPFVFTDFVRVAWNAGLEDFDVMLEAKAQDLALLRLREDIERFAPDVARGLV
ncbi:MAG: UV DNA damage repair endonuclease UvsE [Chloroflexota bacterium]|nr:UV DNA damage repair endonuclease UvsE [Chloroflexota bacterium]